MTQRRRRYVIALAVALAVAIPAAVVGAGYAWWGVGLKVTIENRTGAPLDGLTLVSDGAPDLRTTVPSVAPGSSLQLQPQFPDSETGLRLVDAFGHQYAVLGYVEGNPGGTLTITVTGQSSAGLEGTVVDNNHYAASGQSSFHDLAE